MTDDLDKPLISRHLGSLGWERHTFNFLLQVNQMIRWSIIKTVVSCS